MTDDNGGGQTDAWDRAAPPPGVGNPSEPPQPGPGSVPPPGYGQAPPSGQAGYGPPSYGQQPGYGAQQPYGQPPSYGQSGYGPPPSGTPQYAGGYGYPSGGRVRTNGMAIASLCCSIVGFFLVGIPALVGVILGFVARSQINDSRGAQRGLGLALAGIIVGSIVVLVYIIGIIVIATHPHCHGPHPTGC